MARGLLWLSSLLHHSSSARLPLRLAAPFLAAWLGTGASAQTVATGYLIGPGDRIQVIVRGEPTLSTTVPVRPDGRATFPLVDDVLLSGRTPAAVKRELEKSLARYLRNPLVTVIVRESVGLPTQQIRVVGEVVTPKAIPYRAGITLLDVMQEVGQLSVYAAGNRATIVREADGQVQRIRVRIKDLLKDGDISANVPMRPGDVLLIPEGYWSGESRLTLGYDLGQEVSDNVDLDPSGEEESASITRITPRFSWRADLAGFNGALDAGTEVRHQSDGTDDGWELRPRVIGSATADLISDRAFLDASASVVKEAVSTRDRGAEADESLTQRYLVSPYLRNRFGGFAISELRYSFNVVRINREGSGRDVAAEALDDTTRHSVAYLLGSGRQFTDFLWGFGLLASDEDRQQGRGAERRSVGANAGYPIMRSLAVVGLLGYETLDDVDVDISKETWQLGFKWNPSRRTELKAGYGSRLGIESPIFAYRQDLGPQTRVTASYAETVETGLERAFTDLDQIGIDRETREFTNTFTLLPFQTNTTGFGLSAETTRTKRFNATLSMTRRRDVISLVLRVAEQRGAFTSEEEETEELAATWERALSSRTSITLAGSADRRQFDLTDRRDRTYRLRAGLTRSFGPKVTGDFSYQFRKRNSTDSIEEYTEHRVGLGLQVDF